MSDAKWLDRDEPTRVPISEFKFELKITKHELRQMQTRSLGGDCLASQIAGGGSISRGSVIYGGERINDDGTAEQLVGCRVCGAMCTITYNSDLHTAVAEETPRDALSVAEAPQPNPWDELGSFDDCKAGEISVPQGASNLTEPVGLDYDQRAMYQLLRGHAD